MPNTITDTITELADNKSDIQDALVAKGVTSAGKHGFNKFAEDITSITNQYTSSDEGKVISSGSLVAQTSTTATTNGTIDTTTNNEVVVDVPNTYTAGDEGKVVSGGALIAQTAYPSTITENGTYNTTENNSVVVNIKGSASYVVPQRSPILNQKYGNHWSTMTWWGFTSFVGNKIWTDGTDIYYSQDSDQYVLDKSTHTWSTMIWTGYTNFYGGRSSIWTDGTDIYHSSSTKHYVLDKDNTIFTVKPYIA
jgi:hypothetical protein